MILYTSLGLVLQGLIVQAEIPPATQAQQTFTQPSLVAKGFTIINPGNHLVQFESRETFTAVGFVQHIDATVARTPPLDGFFQFLVLILSNCF